MVTSVRSIGTYPVILASGSPHERGESYGSQTSARIQKSLKNYHDLFEAYAGLDWATVRRYATRYVSIIGDYDPQLIEEMEGIAAGAHVDFEDILAINVRTEVMYGLGEVHAAECTAFAALPEATAEGHTLLGQNWDWSPSAFETCVILLMNQPERPSFITIVEAGLLAKTGMNSNGVGVATNAMASDLDQGAPGLPYHVILRGILNSNSFEDAEGIVRQSHRASSGNYLIASCEGKCIDLEAAPGTENHVFSIQPRAGVLGHANCFVAEGVTVRDETAAKKPQGILRQRRMDSVLSGSAGEITADTMKQILADHTNTPYSLCRHPLDDVEPVFQSATVASTVMDLTDGIIWVADGQPCSHEYREIEPRAFWHEAESTRHDESPAHTSHATWSTKPSPPR